MSFLEASQSTRRLVSLVHSRLQLHSGPVWLYNDAAPTALRDVDFDIARRCPLPGDSRHEPTERLSRVANIEKEETFEIQLAEG